MKKKHKKTIRRADENQVFAGTPGAAGELVHVGDTVLRWPISISPDKKAPQAYWGVVIYVHPMGRYHVVKFGEGSRAIRESFMGVAK